MIAARSPRRSGITLTEILIAILIMAVGLISLATLFPLGLLRLREATRLARAGTTVRTAGDDIDTRGLLYKPSFQATWYGPRDPFVQDALADGTYFTASTTTGPVGKGVIAAGSLTLPANNVTAGNTGAATDLLPLPNGLPVCYDPLWRAVTGIAPYFGTAMSGTSLLSNANYDSKTTYLNTVIPTATWEARFGAGLFYDGKAYSHPYLGNDLTGGGAPSAYGLQRLSNFIPWSSLNSTPAYEFTYSNPLNPAGQPADVAGNVFTSIDDIVFNEFSGRAGAPSSLLPDMSAGGPQADYRFSWFFTGRQTDANGNGAQFTGEIVVCDSRPFGFDLLPGTTSTYAPAGETVVEAVYGYGGNPRAVLLRWNNALADPPIRVGGWICDTTYERNVATYRTRANDTATPFVRCYWYQVAKRTDPGPDADNPATQRSAVVTLATPARVFTGASATPHTNVALIMPSVINVFPRSFEVH